MYTYIGSVPRSCFPGGRMGFRRFKGEIALDFGEGCLIACLTWVAVNV